MSRQHTGSRHALGVRVLARRCHSGRSISHLAATSRVQPHPIDMGQPPRRVDEPWTALSYLHAGNTLSMRVSGDGRYWARTSDPQLVELVLSQLS